MFDSLISYPTYSSMTRRSKAAERRRTMETQDTMLPTLPNFVGAPDQRIAQAQAHLNDLRARRQRGEWQIGDQQIEHAENAVENAKRQAERERAVAAKQQHERENPSQAWQEAERIKAIETGAAFADRPDIQRLIEQKRNSGKYS